MGLLVAPPAQRPEILHLGILKPISIYYVMDIIVDVLFPANLALPSIFGQPSQAKVLPPLAF